MIRPGRDNGTRMDHLTFVHAIASWCEERETYPSRFDVQLANTPRAGMHIHVKARPQHKRQPTTADTQGRLSSHVLIHETHTDSTADRLTTALCALRDRQGLAVRVGLRYMTLLYLVSYDLERAQAGNPSLLLTNGNAQGKEHGQDALVPLWSLDEVLRFWERCDG
jgi:hypothetical protein